MLLANMLKIHRKRMGYTQEQVAQKLHVTTQAVSKWEKGLSVPSIDNLVSLSDLYGISLDELVQGSPFFKKPYIVGQKYSVKKGIWFLFVWLIISLFLTGFGYQPIGLLLFVFLIGCILIFPVLFNDYWVIEQDGLGIQTYSNTTTKKIVELLTYRTEKKINYTDIAAVEIIYQAKQRISPFDISFDPFDLKVILHNGDNMYLELHHSPKMFLPQFSVFLQRQHIQVIMTKLCND
ncbi:helix-turn-helix domain-containing protein [Lysinibacillus piscis]|uniref:Transcriptional regulator n=1 Tax=Lysinibacillus piscis TaxID=2518931 RepID=A0ABQ5NLB5_9BACI|nr:helix-turn-helix transcriptional regulator [Lysinibacillus sp. KH24]GLC89140.1 transcriptional regulator [Lysinibacillus sp. KH24]